MFQKVISYFKLKRKDLTELSYEPEKDELIYHYCANDTLWEILSNQSIWLSSIFRMNDKKELLWGREILINTLHNKKGRYSEEFCHFLLMNVLYLDSHSLPVLCSFSKNGDLLSQWRAYSDDAKGYSIGFNAKKIQDLLPINMKKVSYDIKTHMKLVTNSVYKFNYYWEKSKNFRTEDLVAIFSDTLAEFSADLASLKNPSFFEEQEIRILHLLSRNSKGNKWSDQGGHNIHGNVNGVPVLSRTRDGEETIYINMPLPDTSIISEIVIGAKNPISVEELKVKLRSTGFEHINVLKSSSTYI